MDLSGSSTVFGVPRSHWNASLLNFTWPNDAVREAIMAFLEDLENGKKSNLFFSGPPGVGKTHLAVGLYRWAVKRFGTMDSMFIPVLTFCDEVKRSFGESSPPDFFRSVEQARKVLILDDILGRSPSPWELDNVIYRLINTAYTNGASTIVTTNYTVEKMGTIFKPHEISRLLENVTNIEFKGNDHRLNLG